jgi:uncharacterized protein YbaR (Trm112 family)
MQLTQATLDLLVCPVCHGSLSLAGDNIECTVCYRRYPIVDQLPVLIASRAVIPPPEATCPILR